MRHAHRLAGGLQGVIPGGVSVRDFSAVTGFDAALSRNVLDELVSMGVGRRSGAQYFFQDGDKLSIAIELLKEGCAIGQVSEDLDWRDFEGLAAEILSSRNFAVIRNMILTKPRMEIDVVGVRLGVAMLVDCKHWRRHNNHALQAAVQKQIERTKHYVSKTPGAMAVPVIVTLYRDRASFIDMVPIVPIDKFASFVDEFYGNLDDLALIGTAT